LQQDVLRYNLVLFVTHQNLLEKNEFLRMNDDSLGSISLLFLQLRTGDRDSARLLWQRYFPRLMGLAQSVLTGRKLPLGAEDAVQEAFAKFFQRVESGKYEESLRRDDLWRILGMLTVQKARKQSKREGALKRGSGRVRNESELAIGASGGFRLDMLFLHVNTADCDIIFQEMLDQLADDLQEIAILRLMGYTNGQIKEFLNCSLRSVERRVQLIRSIWQDYSKSD
jgi:DNA-directed RNA polymerase specialized sigma24 family protein